MRRLIVALVVGFGLLAAGVPCLAQQDEEPFRFPTTIPKVWLKTNKRWVSKGGDLTIDRSGIEFVTKKKTRLIPFDQVYSLSFGKFKSDVNTDWAVLGVGASGPAELIAIRDGRKFGYGSRTREIFETLRSALRQLGVGPYDVPEGWVAYDRFEAQCLLAVPEGWDTHIQSLTIEADGDTWGTTIFSSVELDPPSRSSEHPVLLEEDPMLEQVLSGDVPAFFVARREIEAGMACEGFKKKAEQRLLEREAVDPLEHRGYEVVEAPRSEEAWVGGCRGLRTRTTSRRPDGETVHLVLQAVAHDDTFYLFGFRTLDAKLDRAVELFEIAMSTVRFAVAE